MSRFTSLTTVSVVLSAMLEPWINHGVIVMVILLGRPEASRLLWPDKESGQYPPTKRLEELSLQKKKARHLELIRIDYWTNDQKS
ncbi:hypothetical protein VNO80_26736 [Phaseolus coccineus]|uniref:Uncharacterized protein n=1 Tax=Phaseolus coccineus TaxID=3886 RepID=A0AAN9QGY4_PHACN